MMKKLTYTFVVLLLLTGATAFISLLSMISGQLVGFLILAIAMVKVLLVVFQFMELKLAHKAWKVGFVGLLFILGISIVLLIP